MQKKLNNNNFDLIRIFAILFVKIVKFLRKIASKFVKKKIEISAKKIQKNQKMMIPAMMMTIAGCMSPFTTQNPAIKPEITNITNNNDLIAWIIIGAISALILIAVIIKIAKNGKTNAK